MIKKYSLVLAAILCFVLSGFGQIYQHDFGTNAISAHPYTVAPQTFDANLSNSSWANSTSTWTSFNGASGQAISLSNSSGTPTITLTFNVASGYELDVTSFSFWTRRSSTGAQNWSMTINGIAVGSGNVTTGGTSIGTTNVSNTISGLSGTITVQLALSGATASGTFRLDDFTLNGTVTSSCTPPADPVGSISGTTPSCNNTALSYSAPNANLYWQTTATGTSTANPTTATYNVSTSGTYYVRAFDGVSCWSTNSASYAVTINNPPVISTQPPNRNIAIGNNTTFNVVAANATGYQWQVSTNGGANWSNLTNAAPYSNVFTNTLNISNVTLGMHNNLYRCVINANAPCGNLNSASGTLTVFNNPPNNATGLEACIGDTSIDLSWNNSSSGATGYIVFVQPNATIPFMPATSAGDADSYIANTNYTLATTYGTLGRAVYKGSLNNITIIGLTNGLDYTFKVVAYNGNTLTGWASGINSSGSWNDTFLIDTPDANITSASIASTSSVISWTNPLPTSCYEILIVANQGSATTFNPTGDGSGYIANPNYSGPDSFVFKGNGITTTVTGLTDGLNYCYTIFVRNINTNDWSRGNTVCQTTGITYCSSSGGTSTNSGIVNVQLNTINNSSGSTNAYTDFTGITTSLSLGQQYDLSVNVNTGGNYTSHVKVWIDWNRDGSFNNSSNEALELGTLTNTTNGQPSLSPLNISIPTNAAIGNVRMRVSSKSDNGEGYATPCEEGSFNFGEVEDYTINIVRPTGPEIHLKGNNNVINNGDTTTSGLNNTAFGATNVSTSIVKTFDIESIGTGTLNLTGAPQLVQISGTHASDFTVTASPSNSIASGTQTSFDITFTPSDVGTRIATVSIQNNDITDSEDPYVFTVKGVGNGREINVQGNSMNIPNGNVTISPLDHTFIGSANINPLNPTIASKTFEIENLGNQSLNVSTISITGADALDFSVTPTNFSVAAGNSETITVTFDPSTLGIKNAIVSIANNDITGGENPYTFAIQGNALNYTECAPAAPQIIVAQDFESSTSDTWAYTVIHAPIPNYWDVTSNLSIINAAQNGSNFWGITDLERSGHTNQTHEMHFTHTGLTAYENVEFSFYYYTFDLDSEDSLVYEIFYDSASQGTVALLKDSGGWTQVTHAVPDTVNTFEIIIYPDVSAGLTFDEVGLDNFKLTSTVDQVKIWDGFAWNGDGSAPTSYQKAVFTGDYVTANHGGSVEACECEINSTATVTISNNTYLKVENNILVAGEIYVDPQGSLVQMNDLGTMTLTGTGKNTLSKLTHPLQHWYDYTYWSSPLESAQIENALIDANANRRYVYRANFFNDLLIEDANTGTFTPGQDDIDDDGNDWFNQPSGTMTPGVGYAATHSNIGFTANQSYLYLFEGSLTSGGAFNNGFVNVPIYIDPTVVYNNWNFIGNPYPSAISAQTFFEETSSILEGVIYLWSHYTNADANAPGNQNLNFSQDDYAIINYVGGVATGSASVSGSNIPNGYIASGQGFFVIGNKSFAGSPGFYNEPIFNNSMRVTGNNNQFFRTSTTEANRLWVNLTSDNGVFNQVLIGYLDGATNDVDAMAIDALRNLSTGANSILYSLIPESDKKYAIQGKHPNSLNLDEVIPLGFYTSINEATLYSLSIEQFEGEFFSNNNVFVKDNLLNIIHNLNNAPYTFTSGVGEFNERFELVFRDSFLSINEEELTSNHVSIIEHDNGEVTFKVPSQYKIQTVDIIDLLGRTVYNLKGNSSTETYNLSNLSQATYVARVTLANGQVLTKKAVKRK